MRDVHVQEKTVADLSWTALLAKLAERCHTTRGMQLAKELPLCGSIAQAQTRQREVSEARALQDGGEALPFGGITDVRAFVERSEKAGVLVPDELTEIGKTLTAGQRLRRHILSRSARLPTLTQHAEPIAELPEVAGPISDSFDDHGALRDSASPALRGLRQRVQGLLSDLSRRTDSLLCEGHIEPYLQDRFVTQREERYVVPVRADARTKIRGIVHGVSASGATVFVEPEEIIELNNRLKLAQLEVAEEERRILAELSRLVEESSPRILRNLEILAYLDLMDGAAKLASDLRASPVELVDASEQTEKPAQIDLRNGRHPLMVLSGVQVVANDVLLDAGAALVISGPNAGGKTVALKLTGLCVLLSRAGLHVPAQEGSRLPWFDRVLTDVGDDQSLEKNLSTFSAHVLNLCEFLNRADRGTLILLDEIAVGTDPEQGAALAQAVLEGLAARGATVLVTTHYDRLKAMAAESTKFKNASVGFDLKALKPTYKLHLGIPGPSSALPVAERLGLPLPLIRRAESLLKSGQSSVERLMQTLADERERTETMRTEAERLRRIAASEAAEARRAHDDARVELQKARRRAYDEAIETLQSARRELSDLKAALKATRHKTEDGQSDGAQGELSQASKRLDELSQSVRGLVPEKAGPVGRVPSAEELTQGMRVYVTRLSASGVVASDVSRGKVVVQVGALRLTADVAELLILGGSSDRPAPSPKAHRHPPQVVMATSAPIIPPRTPDATIDLRGERLPVAVARTEKFVDDALREGRPAVFILHGHGTGILRSALREHFVAFPGVRKLYPAEPGDGGDGVTVVELDT
ncbi:MAG TPA: endonuclease MutS2 [Pseudomonadota bacterium]|nr:endonuclease MutS2 [Pseudomonadota bacterium]